MFNSPILDLAIALCFTYFVLSLIVSTVHEFMYSVLGSKRSIFLKDAIRGLFQDEHWKSLFEKVFADDNINVLKSPKGKDPSYIPAKNFALALMEQFREKHTLLDMKQVELVLLNDEAAKKKGIEGSIRKALISLYEHAKGDLDKFQEQVETFYNDAMDRAAGVYKRSVQKTILVISLVIASALNVDTIHIAATLWQNPDALKQTADNVQAAVKEINDKTGGNVKDVSFHVDSNKFIVTKRDTSIAVNTVTGAKNIITKTDSSIVYLQNAGVPIGWPATDFPVIGKSTGGTYFWWFLSKIFGILLTASALMLGAPFWFDLVNKFVNIRGTGKKPEQTPATNTGDSKDK